MPVHQINSRDSNIFVSKPYSVFIIIALVLNSWSVFAYKEAKTPEAEQAYYENLAKEHPLYKSFLSKGVPEIPLTRALSWHLHPQSKQHLPNQNFISLADYSKHSAKKRFFVLNMISGEVDSEVISHGGGKYKGERWGDPNHDGMLDRCVRPEPSCCTDTPETTGFNQEIFYTCLLENSCRKNMTRFGAYKTGELFKYEKQLFQNLDRNGNNAMRVEGLEWSNVDAHHKEVIFHVRWYVTAEGNTQGRSYGNFVLPPGKGAPLINKIKGGSLFYAYAPQCE